MPQILLNHDSRSKLAAENLHRLLTERGWSVQGHWQLPTAHRVEDYLETVLPSVGCVVTFWTESSLSDHRVKDIAHEAQRLGVGLALLLEELKLPLALRSIESVDLRHENLALPESQALNEVVDEIEAVLSGKSYSSGESLANEPSLSVRVARRVLEALRNKEALPPEAFGHPERFKIGEWDVDVGANTLVKDNSTKRLAPRSMEVLAFLVARSPETVAVQDLLKHVWRDRIVVDSVVHKCVRELRIALEDDYKQPEYIETFPKRGYRVIAEVA